MNNKIIKNEFNCKSLKIKLNSFCLNLIINCVWKKYLKTAENSFQVILNDSILKNSVLSIKKCTFFGNFFKC